MKIKIELDINTSQLNNVDKVSDLLMTISQELRSQERELYEFIFNLGYQYCEAERNYDYDDRDY